MVSALLVLAAVASASAVEMHLHRSAPLGGSCTTSTNYDFFMLVEQYSITECEDVFSCQSDRQYFTLHGLWPEDNNGDYPCTCTNEAFDPSAIASIQDDMNTYWPSLNGPNDSFWDHEWTKHGTCTGDVFSDQLAFFNGTLSVLQQFDIVRALGAAKITPSNTRGFTLKDFNAAMTTAYGYSALLTCDTQGRIETATLCVGKDLALMDCPSTVPRKCSYSTIYLPASMA